MQLPTQILPLVIFLPTFISHSVGVEDDEEVDPLHFDYDVTSQAMKKNGQSANSVLLEECKMNLEDEENAREKAQLLLLECKKNLEDERHLRKEAQLSLQNILTNFETLQGEKHQLESSLEEQKISLLEQKDTITACELQKQNLKQDTLSVKSDIETLEGEVAEWKKLCVKLPLAVLIGTLGLLYIISRATQQRADIPGDQQAEAPQEGPPRQENLHHGQNADRGGAAAPGQPEHDDDQPDREEQQDEMYQTASRNGGKELSQPVPPVVEE